LSRIFTREFGSADMGVRESARVRDREYGFGFLRNGNDDGAAAEGSLATALDPHPTRDAEWVLRREAIRITQFCESPDLGVLVLDRE
jgi:hypothetical protein